MAGISGFLFDYFASKLGSVNLMAEKNVVVAFSACTMKMVSYTQWLIKNKFVVLRTKLGSYLCCIIDTTSFATSCSWRWFECYSFSNNLIKNGGAESSRPFLLNQSSSRNYPEDNLVQHIIEYEHRERYLGKLTIIKGLYKAGVYRSQVTVMCN